MDVSLRVGGPENGGLSETRRTRGVQEILQASLLRQPRGRPHGTTRRFGAGASGETGRLLSDQEQAASRALLTSSAAPKQASKAQALKVKSGPEFFWDVIIALTVLLDCAAAAGMMLEGFYLHKGDRAMDPLAWQLAFGAATFCIVTKDLQLVFQAVQWLALWLALTVAVALGHLAGTGSYFWRVYAAHFPCFRAGVCYQGHMLVAFAAVSLWLVGSCFFMWIWASACDKVANLSEKGTPEFQLTSLLALMEVEMQRQREAELKRVEEGSRPTTSQTSRGAGAPGEAGELATGAAFAPSAPPLQPASIVQRPTRERTGYTFNTPLSRSMKQASTYVGGTGEEQASLGDTGIAGFSGVNTLPLWPNANSWETMPNANMWWANAGQMGIPDEWAMSSGFTGEFPIAPFTANQGAQGSGYPFFPDPTDLTVYGMGGDTSVQLDMAAMTANARMNNRLF